MGEIEDGIARVERHLDAGRLMSALDVCKSLIAAHGGSHGLDALRRRIEKRIAAVRDSFDQQFQNGVELDRLGRKNEAVAAYRRAIALAPDRAEAYANLAGLLHRAGRLEAAADACLEGLRAVPGFAPLHYNLGVVREARGELAGAIEAYRKAVEAHPRWPEALYNLGAACTAADRLEDAADAYRRALAAKPGYADAANNLGNVLRDLGRFEEAVEAHDRALESEPSHANARFNRGLAYLSLGDYARGWPDYASRYDDPRIRKIGGILDHGLPRWLGGRFDGKTLLVQGEQGAGDTLQFARYLPMTARRGGRVILECDPALVPLMKGIPDLAEVRPRPKDRATVANADFAVPILDLPMIFDTRLDTIPAEIPYIRPDPGAVDRWRKALGAEGFKVGIAYSGNPRNPVNRRRSLPAATLAPLAEIPGVRLFSLQKGPPAAELEAAAFAVEDLGPRLADYAEAAAAIAALDLVVTVCTSVAHLAGAMGAPCWTMLHRVPDWRWLPPADEARWYPGMRLFRQKSAGDWSDVVRRVAAALADEIV